MYTLEVHRKARAFLEALPEKIHGKVRERLLSLREEPRPKESELLVLPDGYRVYRLHVGRVITVFYLVIEETRTVRVLKVMTIEQAHKEYRRWG
ncbi:mRNA-degrading endonuclease RelE of RelBE toxin-antitoxin system [Methanolinea mesophila]|uniref:type II toxin-antitoxin system RelE family toxin n=1 Tax=Methanolinea mesophila TaxID=547055 RepID=UPI001AEB4470|nr:type II toxin-antitoxin system RelE/ParE family toxin [Methanolinea mesophila]MBP1927717.1 mRNA-degrading endonuclease RelE of RelBE toxin-antitoxin system [Methanolinea mesophila]